MVVTILTAGCGSGTRVSPHCLLEQKEGAYRLVTNWEFVHDTVFNVELLGKKGFWVYVYGEFGKNRQKSWVHIWDGDAVKVYEKNGMDNQSYYGRKNATMYAPDKWNTTE